MIQHTTTLTVQGTKLGMQQRPCDTDKLREDLRAYYDKTYGQGNWLIAPTSELPSEFATDPRAAQQAYTIENGVLIKASPEVIAEREAAQAQVTAAVEITKLKTYLTSTDWVVTKCMELGTPITELYQAIHAERNAARARINELEGGANE